jgi:hypothetical protein
VGLQRVEVRSPQGDSALSLRSTSVGGRSISGFVVETTEAPLPDVLAAYAEGRYDIVARTHSGHAAVGSALLVHALLDQPAITYPAAGARGVSTSGLTVTWAADPLASGYTVILEQDDNDGLTIELPPGSSSLVVPEGFLQPATETLLEVGVIGPNDGGLFDPGLGALDDHRLGAASRAVRDGKHAHAVRDRDDRLRVRLVRHHQCHL